MPVILPSDTAFEKSNTSCGVKAAMRAFHQFKNRLFDGFVTTGLLGLNVLTNRGVERERIATGLYPVEVSWWQENRDCQSEESRKILRWAGEKAFIVLAVAKMCERESPLLVLESFIRFTLRCPHA